MRHSILCAGLLLAACTAPEPATDRTADPDTPVSSADAPVSPVAPSPAPAPSPSETGAGVTTLAGEWRVAGIDGGDFNDGYALTLTATGDLLEFSPSCAGPDRRYAIEARALRVWIAEEDKDKALCEIGLSEGVTRMWAAIDSSTRIERTASNGVLLSGGGRSLLLFSQ